MKVSRVYSGFTLIELIVTVSIILMVTIAGLVNYFLFDARQKIIGEARDLVAVIDKVRTKAMVLEYPSGCTGLTAYGVKSVANTGEIEVEVKCAAGSPLPEREKVLSSTRLSSPLSIDFLVQSGRISTGENVIITLISKNNESLTKVITVDANLIDKTQISP